MQKAKKQILILLTICLIIPLLLPINSEAATKISKSKLTMYMGDIEVLKISNTENTIKWTSSNKSVATVTTKGKVTAIGKGNATIKANVGKKTYLCKITVKTLDKSLSDLEKYLLNKKLISGKKTVTAADMIGAKKGFKYEKQSVEIYEYDTKSATYKKLLKTHKVELQGFDYEFSVSAIHGKFVLIFSDDVDNNKIIKAFRNFK